jgi:uncharacterized protein
MFNNKPDGCINRLISAGISCRAGVVGGVALALLAGCDAGPTPEKGVEIQVSGQGEVKATPDQAVVRARLSLQGKESRPLLQRAEQVMEKVLAALREAGLDDKAISAGQVQLQQRWIYHDGQRQADGYTVQRPLSITLDSIQDYPGVIDVMSAQGINTIEGVSFDYSNRQQLMDEATTLAARNAQHQATVAAAAFGDLKCKPLQISLGGTHLPTPRLEMAKLAVSADSAGAYNPGEQNLSANVSVSFLCR